MKQFYLFLTFFLCALNVDAQVDIYSMAWSKVATGMTADWYASDQAKQVAEQVLLYQKDTGGWMKNIEMHQPLTDAQKLDVIAAKSDHSCFDNGATTQEMTFLAKMYTQVKDDRYKTAFNQGLQCILSAQNSAGGWGQYWPLRGGYSDFITFNDNLMINILNLLRNVYQDTGDFADITDAATIATAKTIFNKGLQCILKCQIDDNGTKSIWCAQHDPVNLLPAEGRPFELPSYSGMEGSNVLSFLMTIDTPSDSVKEAVKAAAAWLDQHATLNKTVQDVQVSGVTTDRVIVDAPGKHLWGRFMQLNGTIAQQAYAGLVSRHTGEMRTVTATNGTQFSYDTGKNFTDSYDPAKAYQYMYGIYDDTRQQLYYRPLYNYADTDPVLDANSVKIETSLAADNRRSYQYVGSWAETAVYATYPMWASKYLSAQVGGGQAIELSALTDSIGWLFKGNYNITNTSGKGYSTGVSNTVKYSRNVDFTIVLPAGVTVTNVKFWGYDNYADVDAYLAKLNDESYAATDYVFPIKNGTDPQYTERNITLKNPATGSLYFRFEGQQVAVIITLTVTTNTGVRQITLDPAHSDVYTIDGRLVKRAASEEELQALHKGLYIIGNKRVVVH